MILIKAVMVLVKLVITLASIGVLVSDWYSTVHNTVTGEKRPRAQFRHWLPGSIMLTVWGILALILMWGM